MKIYVFICIDVIVCMYIYTHKDTLKHSHTHTHTYTYTHTHTHTQTHTRTTHTHTQQQLGLENTIGIDVVQLHEMLQSRCCILIQPCNRQGMWALLKGAVWSQGGEGQNYAVGVMKFLKMIIWVSNFRFIPQIFGEVILLPMSKITSPNCSCTQAAVNIAVTDSCHLLVCFISLLALDGGGLLQPVLLDFASSSCCCTFSSNFCVAKAEQICSNSWGSALFNAKFGINLRKWPKNDQNWGMGLSYGPESHRFPTVEFRDIGTGR